VAVRRTKIDLTVRVARETDARAPIAVIVVSVIAFFHAPAHEAVTAGRDAAPVETTVAVVAVAVVAGFTRIERSVPAEGDRRLPRARGAAPVARDPIAVVAFFVARDAAVSARRRLDLAPRVAAVSVDGVAVVAALALPEFAVSTARTIQRRPVEAASENEDERAAPRKGKNAGRSKGPKPQGGRASEGRKIRPPQKVQKSLSRSRCDSVSMA
jgi:hypothetical protein